MGDARNSRFQQHMALMHQHQRPGARWHPTKRGLRSAEHREIVWDMVGTDKIAKNNRNPEQTINRHLLLHPPRNRSSA